MSTGASGGSRTDPTPEAVTVMTAPCTSTSPLFVAWMASLTGCPTEAGDCAADAVSESAAGRRAGPDDAETGSAEKGRPERALDPDKPIVT